MEIKGVNKQGATMQACFVSEVQVQYKAGETHTRKMSFTRHIHNHDGMWCGVPLPTFEPNVGVRMMVDGKQQIVQLYDYTPMLRKAGIKGV